MLTITVNKKGDLYTNLRDDDISMRNCFDVNAVFNMTMEDDEDYGPMEAGDIYDLVAMFIEASKLEGYSPKSIAQAMYDQALNMKFEEKLNLKKELM